MSKKTRIALLIGALLATLWALMPASLKTSTDKRRAGPPVQEVVSPSGLKAWLVEDQSLPIVTFEMAWQGGSVTDPENQRGVTYVLSTMLNEGAGPLDSLAFQKAMADKAITLNFDSSRDHLTGTLRCLSKFKQTCFELLKLALTAPRFDDDALARMKADHHARVRSRQQNPSSIAYDQFFASAFAGHPYAHPSRGAIDSVKALSPEDLAAHFKRHIARDNLYLAVVGDIDGQELAPLMDEIFAALPAQNSLPEIAPAVPQPGPYSAHTQRGGPQTTVVFGFQGIDYHDPLYFPARVLTTVLGDGGLASILTEEVRNKRGLAYSVNTQLMNLTHANMWIGSVASDNKTAQQAMDVIQAEMDKVISAPDAFRETHADSIADVKTYLAGSYALNFDSGKKIAGQLLGVQLIGLPITYFETRNERVHRVTMPQALRAADKLFHQTLRISSVGGTKIALPRQNP